MTLDVHQFEMVGWFGFMNSGIDKKKERMALFINHTTTVKSRDEIQVKVKQIKKINKNILNRGKTSFMNSIDSHSHYN